MIVSELPVPALLMRISTPSKAAATRAQLRSTSPAFETSAAIASAFTRCDAAISPASRSARARSRATIATSTPSAASARATARPMPTLPPVMTARLPLSSRSMSCSHGHCTAPAEARGRLRKTGRAIDRRIRGRARLDWGAADGTILRSWGDHLGILKLTFDPDSLKLLGVDVLGERAAEIVHIGQAVLA